MNRARISDIRRRKLLAYREALGGDDWPAVPADLISDQLYAMMLDRVAGRAPPGFALQFGMSRRLGELGLLGHVVLSCRTLREVLDVWMSHADAAGELIAIEVEVGQGDEGLWITTLRPDRVLSPAAARFCIEEQTATFFAFCRDVTGASFAEFSAEIAHAAALGVVVPTELPGRLRFGCAANRISGPASVLERLTVSRDSETFALLSRQLNDGWAEMSVPDAGPVERALVNFFLQGNARLPSQVEAARGLGMSTRNLVLQLAREGTSYSKVLDGHRRRYAMALLDDGGLCTKQIAHAVGFVHENSFRRAFRGWTGVSIGSYGKTKSRLAKPEV